MSPPATSSGLRLINDVDWTVCGLIKPGRIDELLRQRGDYAALDFASRDQYRTAIEELARRSGRSEYDVAETAVASPQEKSAGETADGFICWAAP